MFCSQCGDENNRNAKFCSNCGQQIDRKSISMNNIPDKIIDLEKIKKQIRVTGRSVYLVGMISLLVSLYFLFAKFSGQDLTDYGFINSYLSILGSMILSGILSYYGNNIWNQYNSDTKRNLQIVLWASLISLGGMIFSLIAYDVISIGWLILVLIIIYTSFAIKSFNKINDTSALSLRDSKGKVGVFLLICLFFFQMVSLIAYDFNDYVSM